MLYHIELGKEGNNLIIYGENGSGKSSIFEALKIFLQSATEIVKIDEKENIFPGYQISRERFNN